MFTPGEFLPATGRIEMGKSWEEIERNGAKKDGNWKKCQSNAQGCLFLVGKAVSEDLRQKISIPTLTYF
jgi:hypothetical protein